MPKLPSAALLLLSLSAILDAQSTNAALIGNTARLTVHFLSEQVSVTRDKQGAIVEGNASDIHQVEDHWTFERDVTSKNPNWKVVET